MLFRQHILKGIAAGRVTLAFRRWRRPPPKEGATIRTHLGVVQIVSVAAIEPEEITPGDVARTGMSADELGASIAGEGTVLRMELRLIGADPRVALRQTLPGDDETAAVVEKLARMDAAAPAPWTAQYLRLIAERPGVVSHALARSVNVETLLFKRRVRRLKELGLTESLEVGYRVSPRGRALLRQLSERGNVV